MEGLINEADHIMEDTIQGAVRDAGIIAAAQKVEHYEIASYGTLATFARTLGEEDAASILEEILAEEKAAMKPSLNSQKRPSMKKLMIRMKKIMKRMM
jgi:ferritin-like metal-binding protein YciE